MLLPNNKNIVPTAAQVGELVEAKTYVVPTTNIAAGLAVMVGYDGEGEPDEVEEMREISTSARRRTNAFQARRASQSARSPGGASGIGFLDGDLIAVESASARRRS